MFIYGIDANALTRPGRTGVERYVYSLLDEMMKCPLEPDERVILYSSASLGDWPELPDGWSNQVLHWWLPKGWTHGRLSWELTRRTPNLFFSPAHEIPLWYGRTKIVNTIHDVAFRIARDVYPPESVKRQEWAVSRATKLADQIITISETTKADLGQLYNVAPERIAVTPLGFDPELFRSDPATIDQVFNQHQLKPGKYFISFGRIEKKKNIQNLIKAFRLACERVGNMGDFQLVLGGGWGYGAEEIKAEIEQAQTSATIKLLGYVQDNELPALIAGAGAYVFPSWYEGFGLPALEALACRVMLIASDIPALREVAGEAAIFIAPDDVDGWARILERSMRGEIDQAPFLEQGQERLELFSWPKTAGLTWQALRSLK